MQHPTQRNTIRVDLNAASQTFVAQLTTSNGQPHGNLQTRLEEKLAHLDQMWEVLYHLARQGMEPQLTALLGIFLQEWAGKEAIAFLLQQHGMVADPTHPVLLQSFWEKLCRQHQALSSELLLYLEQGRRERAQLEAQVQPEDWQEAAFELATSLQQVGQSWQQTALDWQQRAADQMQAREHDYREGHQVANQWSGQALSAIQQAQYGLGRMYDFAEDIHGYTVNLIASTYEHERELLPSAVREATEQVAAQRRNSRLIIAGVFILVIVGLLALAYVLGSTLP